MVGAGALQDAPVLLAQRLGPDVLHAELAQRQHGQHARLDVAADAHDGPLELLHAEAPQGVAVRRVRLDDVGEPVRPGLHELGVLVDAEHVVPEADERFGDRAAEPAEADHHDAVAAWGWGSSQRWGAPPDSGTAAACFAARGRWRR